MSLAGSAVTGSPVHKVSWGHAQPHGSVVRSCPAHGGGVGNSAPKARERQRDCLYSPFAHSFIWGSEGRGEPEAKEFFETGSSYI